MSNKKTNNLVSGKKNTELIKREEIPGTPFTMVEIEGKNHLTMGKYILTYDSFENKDELKKYLTENMWDIVFRVCNIVANEITKQNG